VVPRCPSEGGAWCAGYRAHRRTRSGAVAAGKRAPALQCGRLAGVTWRHRRGRVHRWRDAGAAQPAYVPPPHLPAPRYLHTCARTCVHSDLTAVAGACYPHPTPTLPSSPTPPPPHCEAAARAGVVLRAPPRCPHLLPSLPFPATRATPHLHRFPTHPHTPHPPHPTPTPPQHAAARITGVKTTNYQKKKKKKKKKTPTHRQHGTSSWDLTFFPHHTFPLSHLLLCAITYYSLRTRVWRQPYFGVHCFAMPHTAPLRLPQCGG